MSRIFSVIRRRTNLVDLVTPFVYGTDLYRLKWGANFDTGSFTNFIDAPNGGFIDPSIDRGTSGVQAFKGVRIVFNPATYSIPDGKPFWLRLARVTGGVETLVTPPTLILTEAAHHGVGVVVIAGDAPDESSVADSLEIDLPRLFSDIRITNHEATGSTNLYVATEVDGSETMVAPAVDAGQVVLTLQGTEHTLLVRGSGATATFSATMTSSFPR